MLYKLELAREKVAGYDDHYNHWPSEDMAEITVDQYFDMLETYSWGFVDHKQPTDPLKGERFQSAELHIIEYEGSSFGIVVARAGSRRKFFKFGNMQQYTRAQIQMFGSDG